MVVAVRTDAGALERRLVLATLIPWAGVVALYVVGFGRLSEPWTVLRAVGAAHVGSTVALYADREARDLLRSEPARYFGAPLLGAAVGLAVLLVADPLWLLVGLAGWQIHHTTKQNLGVFAFWARARGVPGLTDDERRLFQLTTVIGCFGVASFDMVDHLLPSADLLEVVGLALLVVAAVRWWQLRTGDLTRDGALLLAVAFYVPLYLVGNVAVAALTFGAAHGAQYFLMMGYMTAGRSRERMAGLVGGVFAAALIASAPIGIVGVAATGVTVAHYVVDAGCWRLSKPAARRYVMSRFAFL